MRFLRVFLWDLAVFYVASYVVLYAGSFLRGLIIMAYIKVRDAIRPPTSPDKSAEKVLQLLAERRAFIAERVRAMARPSR